MIILIFHYMMIHINIDAQKQFLIFADITL